MLYNDHCKAGKELQRKIAKLREENKDPALPQKADPPTMSNALNSNAVNYAGVPRTAVSPPPYVRRMTDSQNNVDESFMLLGQRVSNLHLIYDYPL